ncbi:MAG: hypothetical protein KDA89_14510 [Planctomycetaceae bacterium]|nr:hypothetical protein [Planctomycetaceae bacterium]
MNDRSRDIHGPGAVRPADMGPDNPGSERLLREVPSVIHGFGENASSEVR